MSIATGRGAEKYRGNEREENSVVGAIGRARPLKSTPGTHGALPPLQLLVQAPSRRSVLGHEERLRTCMLMQVADDAVCMRPAVSR